MTLYSIGFHEKIRLQTLCSYTVSPIEKNDAGDPGVIRGKGDGGLDSSTLVDHLLNKPSHTQPVSQAGHRLSQLKLEPHVSHQRQVWGERGAGRRGVQ